MILPLGVATAGGAGVFAALPAPTLPRRGPARRPRRDRLVLGERRSLAHSDRASGHGHPRRLTRPEKAQSPSATVVRPGLELTS